MTRLIRYGARIWFRSRRYGQGAGTVLAIEPTSAYPYLVQPEPPHPEEEVSLHEGEITTTMPASRQWSDVETWLESGE